MSERFDNDDPSQYLLDLIINLEKVNLWELSNFRPNSRESLTSDELKRSVDQLRESQLISIKKDGTSELIAINPSRKNAVMASLSKRYESERINSNHLLELVENRYDNIPRLLSLTLKAEAKKQVSFSDNSTDAILLSLCSELSAAGMAFYNAWSSKKHTYQTYHLRRYPFDVGDALEEFVRSKMNFAAVSSFRDWVILLMVVATEGPLLISDLATNLPGSTPSEVREAAFNLERKGIFAKQGEYLTVDPSIKKLALNYFLVKRSQWLKDEILRNTKRRIGELTSNLYYVGLVKRLLVSHSSTAMNPSFLRIDRTNVTGITDSDLKEAAKLGLLFLTQNEIVLLVDVLKELESIFQTALSDESVIFVHSNNLVEMNVAWRYVFESCDNYVKIQDEHVNEETLELLLSYLPPNINIKILSSIEGPRQLSTDDLKEKVRALKQRIKSDENRVNLRFVGYADNGQSPFHQRYVISRDCCFLVSHAMKDVGKTKEATIVAIPKHKKSGEIEPSFDYWFEDATLQKLKEKGVSRQTYDEWIAEKSKGT